MISTTLWLAGLWSLVTLWTHAVLGHYRVHRRVQNAEMPRFARATTAACWHGLTFILFAQTAGMIALSCVTFRDESVSRLLIGIAAVNLGVAFAFLVQSKKNYRSLWTLPQSLLLGPIGVLALLTTQVPVFLDAKVVLGLSACLCSALLAWLDGNIDARLRMAHQLQLITDVTDLPLRPQQLPSTYNAVHWWVMAVVLGGGSLCLYTIDWAAGILLWSGILVVFIDLVRVVLFLRFETNQWRNFDASILYAAAAGTMRFALIVTLAIQLCYLEF